MYYFTIATPYEAVWIIVRCLLRGRLGAGVVMHDAGHRHDTSALQDLSVGGCHRGG
jgi:hypothetical protein